MFKFFKRRPKTPNGFVRTFLKDSKKKWCQLELYYKGKIILQVESLFHAPTWIDWASVDKNKYKKGYVVHFFIENKNIPNDKIYKNYLLSKEKLNMIEFEDRDLDIVNYVYFFKNNVDPLDMADYMKKIIDNVYKFQGSNPQALFRLRYLKWDNQ